MEFSNGIYRLGSTSSATVNYVLSSYFNFCDNGLMDLMAMGGGGGGGGG